VRFALLCGDETPEDLRELIGNLRERQRRTVIASIRDELDADISEALDMLQRLTALGTEAFELEASDAVGSQYTE
jgi:hypothetical protein